MRSIAECAVGYLFLGADVTQLIVSEHAGVLIMNYTNNPGVKVPHFKFQANQRPSQDDMRLDDARDLASKNEEIIDPNDMEIVRERIIL